MKIGDVSRRLGMPASTIRYYERVGLIERQPRVSGRRHFDDRALFTLQFIRLAQAGGFTIAETKSLLESYASDPSPAGMWIPLVRAKRAAVRQQIGDLQQMDRVLAQLAKCECDTISDCVRAARADSRIRTERNDSDKSH